MLTDLLKRTIQSAVKKMKGVEKRTYQAEVTKEHLGGSARKAERTFGWDREAVKKGQMEIETQIVCIDNFSARGRKKTEELLPNLETDIHELINEKTQADPKFRTPFRYSRISARAVREALIREKGYTDEQLPSRQTIGEILNRLKYRLKKTLKTKPLKKIPETDAIFNNVHQGNAESDESPKSLRISIDSKAKVKIGELSRGGKDRTEEARKANDHDNEVKAKLVPVGILEVVGGQLTIYFGQSFETADLIADVIEQWWQENLHKHPEVNELVINSDNGPSVQSHRTQFLKRMVTFSKKSGLTLRLLYYPPYHSKYNPIEHCWGSLEQYWNGAILDSIQTALEWASNMSWGGLHPIVKLVETTYEKGVKVCRKEMNELQEWITRSDTLPKYDVVIRCA